MNGTNNPNLPSGFENDQDSQEPAPQQQMNYEPPVSQPASESAPSTSDQPRLTPPDNSRKVNWIGAAALLVILAIILYFTGFWNWLADQIAVPGQQQTEDVSQIAEEETETVSEEGPEAVPASKAKVGFVISAGLTQGTVLTSGPPQANLEIRKVYLHNPFKDSWVLVYDGVRPLDLNQLSAQQEKHQLIEVNLLALNYDQAKIEFVDLFTTGQKDSQKVERQRTVDLGPVAVRENQDNIINIKFNIDDPFRPQPVIVR